MSIIIREMRREDKQQLIDILAHIPQFKNNEILVAEEVIDCYLEKGITSGYIIIIATEGDKLAGYICYGPIPLTDSAWSIYWEAVSPKRQGIGVGGLLMETAEENIRQAKGRLILIETSSTHPYENALRFYKYHGYEIVSQVADFYAPSDDRLILRKNL